MHKPFTVYWSVQPHITKFEEKSLRATQLSWCNNQTVFRPGKAEISLGTVFPSKQIFYLAEDSLEPSSKKNGLA